MISDFGLLASTGAVVSSATVALEAACEGQAAMVGVFTAFKVINRKRFSQC